ncbi:MULTISPECIES: class I SAM-dependent methyltransferase [unclassified Beijerinckia]|uniref:SAM-dependent methyltransferase n=1 Tax=unclassified Beijerinckia TaxID=2638183 RepID=UPI0008973704|nr:MULTISPECIES: class I SAM-dependent methyltransferase [unclassified Beijerinckia]MDH7794731.1 2-polyprenyl-3-methyl-5-hydroxy-6-metoxy-1,4-benzoquinol methylase [Beijerinckia sp. GAS462]SEB72977.1 2-polyprenyl-3-methyl-5-hydroxy-6-metoxy-1,4-benzoquinol methylase [Beijerinckia sp. 28-YEA-48]
MDLDEFVRESDRRGGPNTPDCTAYWMNWIYQPQVAIDQTLDPRSDEYCVQQLALYEEMSGRRFDQYANELTAFDLERNILAPNGYDHSDPKILAHQIAQLAHMFRRVPMVRGQHLLDMGCGWGLSSEFGATIGLNVTAVDINPQFIELVRRRAERLSLPIQTVMGSFDDAALPPSYDLVLFYECLHHAYKPWELIAKLARNLSPGGHFLIAGEPLISDWKHWGMRLDPLATYCIRKFGWFESGWSLEFVCSMFEELGMGVEVDHGGPAQFGANFIAGFNIPQRVRVAATASRPWHARLRSALNLA